MTFHRISKNINLVAITDPKLVEECKELINNKETVYAEKLKDTEFACLGTPKQIIDFSKQKTIEKKRFCFDLDNTLVTFPKILNDYTTVKPKIKNIKFTGDKYYKDRKKKP